ncbi:MFS transporter [Streptomyces sp. NPDC047939]|uniref:MFS transporter n=1 Tax=Streptomyces sp. NPDC047939 TaxID=3155381 RepID=UPI003427F8F5
MSTDTSKDAAASGISPAGTTRATIAARFERLPLSRWHVTVRLIVGVVTFFEAFDQLLIAYALPELRDEWQLSTGDATAVLTVGSAGMLVGALLSGRLADRYGRVKVIAYCVAASGLVSLALTACTSLTPFLALRFVQGLAIGGEVPVAAAFISEITRSFKRGRFVLLYELVFPAGLTIGALVAAWVVPAAGWRVMFAVAAVPGLLAFLVQRGVPESPRWLAERGRLRSLWQERRSPLALPAPTDPRLLWFVREAWPSPATGTSLVSGELGSGQGLRLTVESDRLVVFGDGMETDALELTWGQTVRLGISATSLRLTV